MLLFLFSQRKAAILTDDRLYSCAQGNSLAGYLGAIGGSAAHNAASFATMEGMGGIVGSLGYGIGAKTVEGAFGKSVIFQEYQDYVANHGKILEIMERVAAENGMTRGELIKAFQGKEPMKRSVEEQNACVSLRRAFEKELFPDEKVHEEQSFQQGKDIARDNNLGSEEPNEAAVVETMGELAQAEKELQAAMDGNDVFKQVYEKLKAQGLRNDQIYEALIQNGLTEDDLIPLAKYINANNKVQGMLDGTKNGIETNVSKRVTECSYRGTLNGEKQEKGNIVYVTDKNGRTIIVTSGDMAFDADGNPKEGVGDMLMCVDEATNDMDRVSVKDVKFAGTKSTEDYAAEYRQFLEAKNSQAYAEAAAAQGEGTAQEEGGSKAQTETGKKQEGQLKQESPELYKVAKSLQNKVGQSLSKEEADGLVSEMEERAEPAQEGSGSLTFADGTAVPMIKDKKGRNTADYTQMTPEHGAEWIKRTFGDSANAVVDGKIKKAEAVLKKAQKTKIDYTADDADIVEAEAKKRESENAAQRDIDFFTKVKNALKMKESLDAAGGTGATGNRYEQWRKDGYHIGEGNVRYDRQKKEDQTGVYGKEVKVDFAPKVSAKGRAKVVEIDSVQPSHKNGQVNPLHFGPDWQPKDRTDDASLMGQKEALELFDPEKITGDGNAYIESAPSVNERHETIQGNNRVEILRRLYDEYPEKAAEYKQWLIDNAERFGFDAAEIAKMKRPVYVNELPVDDATAKELGQHDVKEFESGGKAIPRTSAVINMLGDRMENVASILMRQGALPDDAKISDLIVRNADDVLDFLSREGVITATEEQTLRKDKTTLRTWLTDLLKNGLFEGDKLSEAAFSQLPDNAQKAVLATYPRDTKSSEDARIKSNILHLSLIHI